MDGCGYGGECGGGAEVRQELVNYVQDICDSRVGCQKRVWMRNRGSGGVLKSGYALRRRVGVLDARPDVLFALGDNARQKEWYWAEMAMIGSFRKNHVNIKGRVCGGIKVS